MGSGTILMGVWYPEMMVTKISIGIEGTSRFFYTGGIMPVVHWDIIAVN